MKNLNIILKSLLENVVSFCCIVIVFYCQLGTDNLFGQQSEHQLAKPYQLPLDQKLPKYLFDSDKNKEWIEHINDNLKNYADDIVESDKNLIMLRYHDNWYKIIRLTPAVVKASDDGHIITFADDSIVCLGIIINNNTEESLRDTVAYSARRFLMSSRYSTWSKRAIKEIKPTGPNFERVNFASYYYPLDYMNTYYINSQNIFITVFGHNFFDEKIKDDRTPHVRWQTVAQLVNSITSVFAEPTKDHIFKESDDIILKKLKIDKWSQKKNGYCEFEWEVKGELKDYWVVVRSTYGTISIISPDKSLFSQEREDHFNSNDKNKKLEDSSYVHQGIISISNMHDKENILTIYAITADGKTWYRRQIKIDPKELLTIASEVYRKWKSFDDQYSIIARLISISGVDVFDSDKIDLDKLKDKIVTIEKSENKKLVEIKFSDLSKIDQEYILQQIKTQK